jgi:hypothetical protein
MALVPTGGALRAFVRRKDLETRRKLLAGSKGEAERSRPKRLLTADEANEPPRGERKVGWRRPSRPSRA